jgi:hypothetical protein
VLLVLGGVLLAALLAAGVLLALLYRRLARLQVPPDAGFFTTLRAVPLGLAVALDLLDLGLDTLSAPLVWVILDRLRLGGLRDVATLEALIPFTGPLPTFTAAWCLARWLDLGDPPDPQVIETERVGPGSYRPR